ncbi:MAG: thermonuclease family protein [Solirubrobacterales bacterium]
MVALALLLLVGRKHHSEPPEAAIEGGGGRAAALVTRVADGDTIAVSLGGHEEDVRLIGIDTPETVDPDEPVQCFGPQASAFTHRLLEGRRVELEFDAERRDRYGRLLAYVHLDGHLVNAMLARRGLARPLTIAPNDSRAALFERLTAAAGKSARGLWGACGDLPSL